MKNSYFANGKLLLTGEYAVLDGAKAICLPTKLGQHLWVSESNKNPKGMIHWISKLKDDTTWLDAEISIQDFSVISSSSMEKGHIIAYILQEVNGLNPKAFNPNKSYTFETTLDFPQDWGLGSSSTLLVLLSKFADIDAFKLSSQTFGGSGYDISCAMMPKTQWYQLYKNQRKVSFIQLPSFVKENGYFVHLNQKQNSREGIAHYRSIPPSKSLVKSITDISEKLLKAPDLYEFEDLLFVHESLISDHLNMPTVQERLFTDYTGGIIKSLGAWGGDFVFVTAENQQSLSYFKKKGFETILSWNDLILD